MQFVVGGCESREMANSPFCSRYFVRIPCRSLRASLVWSALRQEDAPDRSEVCILGHEWPSARVRAHARRQASAPTGMPRTHSGRRLCYVASGRTRGLENQ